MSHCYPPPSPRRYESSAQHHTRGVKTDGSTTMHERLMGGEEVPSPQFETKKHQEKVQSSDFLFGDFR